MSGNQSKTPNNIIARNFEYNYVYSVSLTKIFFAVLFLFPPQRHSYIRNNSTQCHQVIHLELCYKQYKESLQDFKLLSLENKCFRSKLIYIYINIILKITNDFDNIKLENLFPKLKKILLSKTILKQMAINYSYKVRTFLGKRKKYFFTYKITSV